MFSKIQKSVYFRLFPRTLNDVKQVLTQVMDKFIEYNIRDVEILIRFVIEGSFVYVETSEFFLT